jgi:aldose sugar dehydrogenase
MNRFVLLVALIVISAAGFVLFMTAAGQPDASEERNYPESALPSPLGPVIKDPTLRAEVVLRGLTYATDIAFLGPNDILVTEKDTGDVRRIVNGVMLQEPLLDVNVATYGHRGMLGITVSNITTSSSTSSPSSFYVLDGKTMTSTSTNTNTNSTKYVFLYYTAAQMQDGEDITQAKQPLGNVVYRYEFVNNSSRLINPKLLLDLPATPGAIGNGGKVLVNPYDNNLYITIGGVGEDGHKTKAQNVKSGVEPDGTSGILRITLDGEPVVRNGSSILGNESFLNKYYYAYGIWNSFGIDFDPITGKLWDTENGVIFGDEVNLVEPGFNSGWNKIDGIWLRGYPIENTEDKTISIEVEQANNLLLEDFGGKGKYSTPEFTWFDDIGPTAIRFLNSDKLGKQYENDIFVGDIINGNIYHFDLNKERTELLFSPTTPFSDKILSSNESRSNDEIVFGKGLAVLLI